MVKMTPVRRIEGRKRKDSTKRLDSDILIVESTGKFGLIIVTETLSSGSSIFRKSSKRKTISEESEGPSSKKTSPEEIPSQEPPKTHCSPTISSTDRKGHFLKTYQQLDVLGKGGFATVFSGIRVKDNFPVAIKHVHQHRIARTTMVLNGKSTDVPLEVALLIQVGAGPDDTESRITPRLLEWFDLEDELFMVFEKPEICMDLYKYLQITDKPLSEAHVKIIMKQLINTAIEMHNKGVFHRDIKPQNILVETSLDGPRVRYIDFGCGITFTPGQRFERKAGTRLYSSPEWFKYGFCDAEYTTVWQLGVVMYQLLHKRLPFNCDLKIINHDDPPISADISKKCRMFLSGCLRKRYKRRFSLKDLLKHVWLKRNLCTTD